MLSTSRKINSPAHPKPGEPTLMIRLSLLLFLSSVCAHGHFDKPTQQLDIPKEAKFVKLVYEFRNGTDKPIKFLGIVADCDCVQVEVIPEDAAKAGFQPGEVGCLNVVMHVQRKVNKANMYVQFQSGDIVDTFKISAHLNRMAPVVLSSDKLYIAPDKTNVIHRVKGLNDSLSGCRLQFDKKLLEARIENDSLLIKSLHKGAGREFIELLKDENGKERIVGMLEINFSK